MKWKSIRYSLEEFAIEFIKSKGGLNAIAFSHPHFHSNMNEWAEIFGCPVYNRSPNRIPLPLAEMRRIKNRFESIPFDSFLGYIKPQNRDKDVKEILEASMAKYM